MKKESINENEKSKNEANSINSCISIILFVVFISIIGGRLYTKHLEKATTDEVNQLIKKGLLQKNTKNNIILETYSNDIIYFNYPNTCKISDVTAENGIYYVICQISDISMLHITYAKNNNLKNLNNKEKKKVCIEGLYDYKTDIKEYFSISNFTSTAINPSSKGCFNGYSFAYHGSLNTISVHGEVFSCINDNCILFLNKQFENEDYQVKLEKIIETIKFK